MLDRGSEILSFLEERATDLNNGTANLNVGWALTKLGESGWFGYAIPESLGGRRPGWLLITGSRGDLLCVPMLPDHRFCFLVSARLHSISGRQ